LLRTAPRSSRYPKVLLRLILPLQQVHDKHFETAGYRALVPFAQVFYFLRDVRQVGLIGAAVAEKIDVVPDPLVEIRS
jgi:hypothetical protein